MRWNPIPPIAFVKLDIGDFDSVSAFLVQRSPAAVVNFAAESHVDRSIHGPGEFVRELEITDVNRRDLEQGKLKVKMLGRGDAWLDTGTHESLLEASQFISTIEHRQGLKIACPEEIAYPLGYIDAGQLREPARPMGGSTYGRYLPDVLEDGASG